ncbi:MAG: hypothetical protein IJZ70_06945 [Bacteroidales bacterium]|nr:hypothetical protein [Bacteroidales bacterium]MBQ8812031.1 hypothetical protein [Bacteroidales bacterium]
MAKRKYSYSRFYAIAKAKGIDLEVHKETLISQFTNGRTTSLKDMKQKEYDEMCDCLQTGRKPNETADQHKARLKACRSDVLHRLQKLGLDTTDWDKVNEFCKDPRIAGKPFALLTIEELRALVPKLEAILRKPKKQPEQPKPQVQQPKQWILQIPISMITNQYKS